MTPETVLAWFSQYAYEPVWVYSGMVALMFASAFGLPLPEEVPLIGAGLVAYMARNPQLYPPPEIGAARVEVITLAGVAFLSVVLSDYLVFYIGRYGVRHAETQGWYQRFSSRDTMRRLKGWTNRYGMWACGLFRFTPGLRFPGFLACGALGVPRGQFLLVDGVAAFLSVPTQVILVGLYGDRILHYFKDLRVLAAVLLLVALFLFLVKRLTQARPEPS